MNVVVSVQLEERSLALNAQRSYRNAIKRKRNVSLYLHRYRTMKHGSYYHGIYAELTSFHSCIHSRRCMLATQHVNTFNVNINVKFK